MRRSILSVLALGFLLPTLLGKERRKIDPMLKSVHTIFVKGKDDPWVRNARESLVIVGCFQLAPDGENADALMTVLWSSETQAYVNVPYAGGGIGAQTPVANSGKLIRSTVTLKVREGSKLKKVWSDSIDLARFEESKKSGVRRLIEKLSQDVCAKP